MSKVRPRGEDVRRYIIQHVEKDPRGIAAAAARRFGISRQAVNKHLKRLTDENVVQVSGKTRSRTYRLAPLVEVRRTYSIDAGLAEDVVWTSDIRPALGPLPDNVIDIWHHGFTEMFNNAIDHSGGTYIGVQVKKTAADAEILVSDDGVGIFRKIQRALNLLDERHAVLELAKGKLTTDPRHHSGEGIFFTSRMFDSFDIMSGGVYFSHAFGDDDDLVSESDSSQEGTFVWMKLSNHTARTTRKVFDQFSSADEDYAFNKTIVPVKLARYGDDNLISRSQAKRLLARIELFKYVILDFHEVASIGQAFADEIFRVFAQAHPDITLTAVRENSAVKRMIERARSGPALSGT